MEQKIILLVVIIIFVISVSMSGLGVFLFKDTLFPPSPQPQPQRQTQPHTQAPRASPQPTTPLVISGETIKDPSGYTWSRGYIVSRKHIGGTSDDWCESCGYGPTTKAECQSNCASKSNCLHWAIRKRDNKCFLFETASADADAGHVRGFKNNKEGNTDPRAAKYTDSSNWADPSQPVTQMSFDDCKKRCDDSTACSAFFYRISSHPGARMPRTCVTVEPTSPLPAGYDSFEEGGVNR